MRTSRIYGLYSEVLLVLMWYTESGNSKNPEILDRYIAESRVLKVIEFELLEINCSILAVSRRYGG